LPDPENNFTPGEDMKNFFDSIISFRHNAQRFSQLQAFSAILVNAYKLRVRYFGEDEKLSRITTLPDKPT
jgi:hypothetical protein